VLLRHARYLIAVVDHGSFTRAALALHVSQPALSQQIRQIEEQLGAQLLDRTGRVVRATDAGEAFLAHARRALADLEAGQRAVRDVHDLSSGVLRIGFTPTFVAHLVGPLVQQFRERYPGVTLCILSLAQSDIEAALGADALDIGVGFTEVQADDIDWMPLYEERLTVIVGERHPSACEKTTMDAEALEKESLALLGPTFATRTTINLYFRRVGIRPRVVVEANSNEAIVEIIRHGSLATILPEAIAQEQPGICAIQLTPALDPRRVALLQRRGGYRSAASRAFVDLVSARAGEGRRLGF
jgi:LysR family cyn operon transcriptional activator